MNRRALVTATSVALLGFGALAGCTTSSPPSTASATASQPAVTSAPATTSPVASAPAATASAKLQTVNVNTATKDEIAAALTANGVQNAEKWADEIEEYKEEMGGAYTAENLAPTLQKELAKYNIAPEQMTVILGTLTV